MEANASKPLGPVWKDRLSLSARVAPEFYEQSDDVGDVPHAGALRTALDDLRGSAVFCVQDVPTVVILSVDEYDPAAVAPLRAALWNQGLASLLLVVSADTVRVFTLARIQRGGHEDDVTGCLVEELHAATDALALRNLVYAAESGRYWDAHSDHFRPEERVDRVLLDNLTQSHKQLRAAGLSPDAAQALLVQTMFVAYLEDRKIVGAECFRDASNARADGFEALLRSGDVESLERLFGALRKDFNGDLFVAPCSFDVDDRGPRLGPSHLEILARFRLGREEMHGPGGQYRFWPYDFKYIPVELISAVHDRFLGEREPARRARGAYYTPMFLADTVVSHVWDRLLPAVRDDGRFLDPACGSGIFLVRLFQRLCEHRRAARGGPAIPWDDLIDVISRLQGRDLDGGALRMAVFSLYVALLEEVTPPAVRTLMKRGRMLPPLYGKTLRRGDFFAVEPDDAPADVIIGNPPWSSRRGERHSPLEWCAGEDLPAPGREQAWPFVWKSLRRLRENGVGALLLPAMGFLHNHAGDAVEARKRLLREARVLSVVNFADLRFQLFDGAVRPAALLVFGRPPAGGAAYRFDYLMPKADLNLKSRRLITLGRADRCRLDSRMVEADPSVFKKRLWLSEPEARLFNYLEQFPRLGGLVAQFGTLSRGKESTQGRWVVGQGFQPANAARLRHAGHERSHIVATTPYLPIGKFRVLAQTGDELKPWKDGVVRRKGYEAGFKGPRVLVPGGVAGGAGRRGPRLRAVYVEDPLTFQHIIQAIVVGQGFQPVNAARLRHAGHERSHVVARTLYLPIRGFRGLARTGDELKPWKDGLVRRRGFEAGFKGPRVLVPRGVAAGRKGPRLRAAYVEDPLTFQHIIQAIVVPPGDERRGMLLAGLLNSRLMLWFAFHGTSSFGADRPKVQQAELLRLPFPAPDDLPDRERSRAAAEALAAVVEKQLRRLDPASAPLDPALDRRPDDRELLAEIDDLACEFFCLSEAERVLVEDTVEHVIPAAQPTRRCLPAIWRPSTPGDRGAYARTLAGALADWLDGDCSIGTRLVARNDDLAILRLSLRDGPGAFDYAEDDDESVAAALSRLAEHVHQPLPGNFQSLPDFRVFVGRDLFLVKPAGKRFWLRSAALADADAIALDLHAASGGRDAGGRDRA